jgi:hypothetical protein
MLPNQSKCQNTFYFQEFSSLFPSNYIYLNFTSDKKKTYSLSKTNNKNNIKGFEIYNSTKFTANLSHVAFFCKLEDKIFSELNLWIKFRAGTDDVYNKLIKVR